MPLYRLLARNDLFNTGVSEPGDLDYTKADGSPWPITSVNYNEVNRLNNACNQRTFMADGDLDARAREAALAAIFETLRGLNLPTAGWDVIVNSSQPAGGAWNDQSTERWLHFTKLEGSTEGIVASPHSLLAEGGGVDTTWWVVSITAELDD